MKTFLFVGFLLPAAVFGQTVTVGPRVSEILSAGVQGGVQGLYLKQVNGPLLAVQQDRVVFDPANSVALIPLLYAMERVRIGAIALDTPISRYTNGPDTCPSPPVPSGDEPLLTALREMMWHSDNARMHALQVTFGRSTLDLFARGLGVGTSQPQIPGCQTPGRATLRELAGLWEAIALGNLPTFDRRTFLGLLPGKAQAQAESTDSERIWDTEIPRIMREEAPPEITQAQMTQYQASMDLQYKSGATLLCRQTACTEILEDRSIAGWARIPFCTGGVTVGREYVFGLYITGALDPAWTPGRITAAQRAYNTARAELLRELIRDGMASCYGGDAVLVTPAPGSTLTGRTVIFGWSSAANATGYRLDVGTTAGGTELGTQFTAATSAVVTNIPCAGAPVYARLWTRTDQYGSPKDYAFQACRQSGPAITAPVPGSTLTTSPITFRWTAVTDADLYRFSVGSSLGSNDFGTSDLVTNSVTVSNLPTDGRIIFVRVQAHTPMGGFGAASDYAYNNLAGVLPAVSSIVNAVTKLPNLSPACLVTLNGANFSTDVTVTVNGTRAQVVSSSPGSGQLNFIMPPTSGTGARTVVVASGGATGLPFPVTLVETSPGIATPLMDAGGSPLGGRSLKPGDTVVMRVVGLGPLGADGRPVLRYTVDIGGIQATVRSLTPLVDQPGYVQLVVSIPGNAVSGGQQLVVKSGAAVASGTGPGVSNSVPVLIAGPSIASALNGASFARDGKVAPGSLVALFGTDLAAEDRFGLYPSPLLPGGGVVTINGVSAPLFDAVPSAGQINLLVPFETPVIGSVPVVVTNAAGTSLAFQLPMAAAAPGIFRIPDPSNAQRRNAAALLANTAWRVMPSAMAAALGMPQNCKGGGIGAAAICGEPAAAGDPIQIYVTGLGRATPNGNPVGNTLRTGDIAPADGSVLYRTVETPRVTISGIDATVAFSGIAPGYAGLYQINVTIPRGAPSGDDVPVVIEIGGASDTATIAIRP